MERVIDVDPLTGLKTIFDWDATENRFRLGYEQDTSPVIEDNKAAALDLDTHRKQAKEDWAHYAKIPTIVQYEWLYKHGVDFNKKDHWKGVMRLLNSPDYKYLKRTSYYHDR
jgi:hypothetical protein